MKPAVLDSVKAFYFDHLLCITLVIKHVLHNEKVNGYNQIVSWGYK